MRLFASFVFILSFLLQHAHSQIAGSVTVTSNYVGQSLDIFLNKTTGQLDYNIGDPSSLITVAGKVGDTIDLKVVRDIDLDSSEEYTITIRLGTAKYVFSTATVGYTMKNGGMVHLRSYAEMTNTQKDVVEETLDILNNESPLPSGVAEAHGTRKRSPGQEDAPLKLQGSTEERNYKVASPGKPTPKTTRFPLLCFVSFLSRSLTHSLSFFCNRFTESTVSGSLSKAFVLSSVLSENKFKKPARPDGKPLSQNAVDIDEAVTDLEELLFAQLIRIQMGIPDDMELMPDSHYLYEKDGNWKSSKELTAKERFVARVNGLAVPVMEEINGYMAAIQTQLETAVKQRAFFDKYNDYIQEVSWYQQNGMHHPTGYMDMEVFLKEVHAPEQTRGKRSDQPSLETIVQYPDVLKIINENGAACRDMSPTLAVFNAAACTLVALAKLNTQVQGIADSIQKIKSALQQQKSINDNFIKLGQNQETQLQNLLAIAGLQQQQNVQATNAIGDLTKAANTATVAQQIGIATDQRLSYQQQLQTFATATNNQRTNDAINGQAEIVNEQLVVLSGAIEQQRIQFQDATDNAVRGVMTTIATVQSQVTSKNPLFPIGCFLLLLFFLFLFFLFFFANPHPRTSPPRTPSFPLCRGPQPNR
jgi:hypothetical protein